MATDPGLQLLGFSQEGRPVLVSSGARGPETMSKVNYAAARAEQAADQVAHSGYSWPNGPFFRAGP